METIREKKLSPLWRTAAECIIYLFAVVGCLEKIHDLYSLVMVLDGITAVMAFFFIILWFFLSREFRSNTASVSLGVLTLVILVSSIVCSSDVPRLLVALYSLIESWALGIAVMLLGKKRRRVIAGVYIFIIAFTVFYALFSLLTGIEKGEVRFSGLSDQTNSLAVVAASTALICLCLIGERRNIILTVLSTVLLLAVIALSAYTLTKTDSRTSFFALIVALCFFLVLTFLFFRERFQLILAVLISLLLIAGVVAFLLSGSSHSEGSLTLASLTSGRTTIWGETLSRMEAQEYLFGFGGNSEAMKTALEARGIPASIGEYLWEKHLMHNIYLQFLVEYGIVSAAAFICGSFYLFSRALAIMRRHRSSRFLLIPSAVLLLFFFVHSLAESSIYFIGGEEQFLFILSASVIYSYYRREEKEK